MSYEQGWNDAFKAISDYVEAEVCIVTAEMIRRMKDEAWRNLQKQATVKPTKNRGVK